MSRKIDVEARGEILILKDTINDMVDRLNSFCNEVQRVARDVGIDGILGGQADVAGLKGRWKEITTDVNTMANNLVSFEKTLDHYIMSVAGTNTSHRRLKCAPSGTSPMLPPTETLPRSWRSKHPARWMS